MKDKILNMLNLEKVGLDTLALCRKDTNTSSIHLVDDLCVKDDRVNAATPVNVVNEDYISLAYDMTNKYKKVALLNMSSEMKPGGRFLKGATRFVLHHQ